MCILAIFYKELRSNFYSFSLYLVFALFALVTGFFFFANLADFSALSNQFLERSSDSPNILMNFTQAVITPFFMNVCLVLLLIAPLVTMRTFAEEKKQGTFELLFTYPVSDLQIVTAKFLALLVFLFFLLVPAGICFSVFFNIKGGVDIPIFLVAFTGIFLFGCMLFSLGMLMSSVTDSQLMSAVSTFLIVLLMWVVGWVSEWVSPGLSRWMNEFWVVKHMRDFTKGVLDSNYIAFYVIATGFFFTATVLSLEARTWKR